MDIPLPHLFIYPSLSLSLSLTSSSPQLIISHFHLLLSPSHLLNFLTSSSPQLIVLRISYLNPVLGFFFSLLVVPIILLLFKSQRCVLFPFVSLFIFVIVFI
jgi:hypothetical protein